MVSTHHTHTTQMGVLYTSMHQLNTSLADINLVKTQITEMGVSINRYDNQLLELKKGMADVHLGHREMKESVDAAVNSVADFEVRRVRIVCQDECLINCVLA